MSEDKKQPRDKELGLDLNRPLDEIDMVAYILRWDEASQSLVLTDEETVERYHRLVAFMAPNRAYWDARIGVPFLEHALASLQDRETPTNQLIEVVGASLAYG